MTLYSSRYIADAFNGCPPTTIRDARGLQASDPAWFETNGAMEFHLYSDGGHGFGTLRKGTSSSSWLEQYVNWLTLGAGSGK